MSDSPWMTTQETARYARVHENTVLLALRRCVATSGREGMKGYQRAPNASWRIHREDADAWICGRAPSRGTRRLSVAS